MKNVSAAYSEDNGRRNEKYISVDK